MAGEIKQNWLDRILLALVRAFIYIAFIFATLADLSLNALLYSLFGPVIGPDWFYKVATAIWGLVITGAKLWAWSSGKIVLGVACAIFSTLGVIGVFNSAMELQGKEAKIINEQITLNQRVTSPEANLQTQIDSLNRSIDAREKDLSRDQPEWSKSESKWYLSQDKVRLGHLTDQLTDLQKVKTKEIVIENKLVLDLYNIFGQIAVRIGIDRSIFSFWFIFFMAILVEIIIYYTTPRKLLTK